MLKRISADYLSVRGRLARLVYWLRSLVASIASGIGFAAAAFVEPYSRAAFFALAGAAFLIALAVWISLVTRRFQDHGRAGGLGASVLAVSAAIAYAGGIGFVWTPVATLAGVVSLALFAYLGFVRGERGPNAYGPDPLEG